MIFINISDHVESSTQCSQASASYSLPGTLLNIHAISRLETHSYYENSIK